MGSAAFSDPQVPSSVLAMLGSLLSGHYGVRRQNYGEVKNTGSITSINIFSSYKEDGSYHIAQVGPGDSGRKKSKKGMDLIWI